MSVDPEAAQFTIPKYVPEPLTASQKEAVALVSTARNALFVRIAVMAEHGNLTPVELKQVAEAYRFALDPWGDSP